MKRTGSTGVTSILVCCLQKNVVHAEQMTETYQKNYYLELRLAADKFEDIATQKTAEHNMILSSLVE